MNWFAKNSALRQPNPWRVHGYFFCFCYPLFAIPIMRWSVSWMDIPPDVPVKDVLSPAMGVLFIALLAVSHVPAYLLARLLSLGKIALVEALRRRIERARTAP